jgi:hypothetical protein
VKNFYHVVGMSFEEFEDELMALFISIEASRHQTVRLILLTISKSTNRGHHELKRLARSINYDLKGGHSSRGKGKGRDPTCYS